MLKERGRKIDPFWIEGFHKCVLFAAHPTFYLFLTSDRVANVFECLVIDEDVNFVFFRVTLYGIILVLPDAADQVVRHAGVEDDSAAIGHEIDVVRFHCDCEVLRRLRGSG